MLEQIFQGYMSKMKMKDNSILNITLKEPVAVVCRLTCSKYTYLL